VLGIKTLETRRSDSLDFHEVSVWGIKRALEVAYHMGKAEGTEEGLEQAGIWETPKKP
jgi:hypothetical protein